uniref:UDP-3-O-acyl-N-acetylglucosamine deacetylase n=1 Tax=Kalanchoe fedtschenkoi TaxID=63787 RepID=A0A7N0VNG0_KALFE
MKLPAGVNALKTGPSVVWKSTGKVQQTLVECVEISGKGLHSGEVARVRLWPELAGRGRYFCFGSQSIPACIEFAEETPLCTTLCKDGMRVRTVEHLLSALEAMGVDNCRIEIEGSNSTDNSVEVPILDGSAKEWVHAIEETGLRVASDQGGNPYDQLAPHLNEPVHVFRNDAFVAAFPSPSRQVTCGIDFPQVPAIGRQWFSSGLLDKTCYTREIASSRTFCVFEEVEKMQKAGLIKGGSKENAIVCSSTEGWLNPPLHFIDEPCRHKALDLIGDLSLFAASGSQGLPVAHIVAYKAGHALHADFVRRLSQVS